MKMILPAAVLAVSLLTTGCFVTRERVIVTDPVPTTTVYRSGYVVKTLPTGYRTVRVNRSNYYVYNDVYYRPHRGGYVVVDRPL